MAEGTKPSTALEAEKTITLTSTNGRWECKINIKDSSHPVLMRDLFFIQRTIKLAQRSFMKEFRLKQAMAQKSAEKKAVNIEPVKGQVTNVAAE